MKLLTFQARRFAWRGFERTLAEGSEPRAELEDQSLDGAMDEAVVAFLHLEAKDESEPERSRVFRHVLKQLKWLAGKRGWKRAVLHSFTHLGGDSASAELARSFLLELSERLRATGYEVALTPFGYTCEWELSVRGESLAKVWKES